MIYSYFSIALAVSSIYPLFLAVSLAKRKGYWNISIFTAIMMGVIICEGLGQVGVLLRLPILYGISILNGGYILFIWYFALFSSVFFAIRGLQEVRKTIDSSNRYLFFLEKKVEEIEAVQNVTKILASPAYTLHEKLQKTLAIAIKQVAADHGSIMLKSMATDELEIMAATDKNLIGLKKPVSEGISGLVVREAKVLNVEDIKLDDRFKKGFLDKYKKDSFLSIPIKVRNEVMGVLNVSDKVEGDMFTSKDEDLLINFIEKVASFIENAELYEQLEKE